MREENIHMSVSQWLQGDDDAFKLVFYYYYPRLYRYIYKYLQNRTSAEDMVMEVLVKTWQKKDSITSADTF